MNDKYFRYIVNIYFTFNLLSWFHDIYIYIYIILVFSSLVFSFFILFLIMASIYLSKHFNFISIYNGLFNNLSYYKCLCNDASKIP